METPRVEITPTSKYFIGKEQEDVRSKVSMTPTSLTEAKLLTYTQTPSVSKELVNGNLRDVYTYKGEGGEEVSIMSVRSNSEIPNIIETAKLIINYADQNGTLQQTENGFYTEIDFNSYLEHRGYKKRKDGSYKPETRHKVWLELQEAFRTPVKMAVRFTNAPTGQVKTLVTEIPLINLGELYDTDNTKEAINLSISTPPKSFVISIAQAIALQMTGYRDGKTYYNRNLLVEPKREAEANRYDLQGYKARVADKLFSEFNKSAQPIRRYSVKALKEVIGGREKDKTHKLIETLNLLEQRGEIKEWVFCASRHKNYTKKEKKQPLIWVNHEGTSTLIKLNDVYKGKNKRLALERQKKTEERLKKVEKVVKKLQNDL